MAIKMEPAICSQCGAQVEVDPTKTKAVCEFCGTPFAVSNAIENYKAEYNQTYNTYNVHHAKKGVAESAFDFLDKQMERKEQRQLREEERRRAIWKNIGLAFLWICFLPFMFCYWLFKTDKLSPKIKKGIAIGFAALVVISMIADAISGGGEAEKKAIAAVPSQVNKATTEYVSLKNTDFAESTGTNTIGDVTYDYPASWLIETRNGESSSRHLLQGSSDNILICEQQQVDARGYNKVSVLGELYKNYEKDSTATFLGYQKILVDGAPGILIDAMQEDSQAITMVLFLPDDYHLCRVTLFNKEALSDSDKANFIALLESMKAE